MKLTAELNLTNQGNKCQFGVEIELDDNADIDEIREKTNKATAALKMAVNSVINIKALNNVPVSNLPKQLPTDSASQGQRKYLKDLTGKCGTTLKKWCQSKGVNENEITGAHCQEWIPELREKLKANVSEDDKFFLS